MRRVLWVVAVLATACGEEKVDINYEPRPLSTDASAPACTSNAQCGAGATCFVYESPTTVESLCAPTHGPCDIVTCAEDTARCLHLPNEGNVVCVTVMNTLLGT